MYRVTLSVDAGIATIAGEAERTCRLGDLRVSERTRNNRRKVTFPDEAYLEIHDSNAFDALLAETGYRDSAVVRMQQSWRRTLIAALLVAAIFVLGYLYGLPLTAKIIADALPEKVERTIGNGTLAFLDQRIFSPSMLPAARRDAIAARFKALAPPQNDAPAYEIVFRKSRIGPNAFALPSGQIVLTDEMVRLIDNDDQLMSVLAHELGHLHERHLTRRIVQSSAIGAVMTMIFGDVSAIVANIPTLILDLKYSRDAEREADDYAIAMLKKNGIPLSQMIAGFEKMKDNNGESAPYLSTHPPTAERIEHIRQAE